MNLIKPAEKFFPDIDFVFAKIADGKNLFCACKTVTIRRPRLLAGLIFGNGRVPADFAIAGFVLIWRGADGSAFWTRNSLDLPNNVRRELSRPLVFD